ncbi:DUF423 domain-containing protein [uncultured Polaribacter sp.]|uniref:DUF423 domain-containing protein n=1 Tax=uncultured Polaribacter sp. TaxID=174711 RepID=UPI0026124897|nr:DUF423 domain-containing protein [uncultured Polaribacter sp.]
MHQFAILTGATFGFLAIILASFGAHFLKKKLTLEQLQSFETGVKYQMYHAIVLVVLGFQFTSELTIDNYIVYAFVIGILLFSFSIYGLVISSANNKKLTFLGPITPLGGLFLALGWGLLIYKYSF